MQLRSFFNLRRCLFIAAAGVALGLFLLFVPRVHAQEKAGDINPSPDTCASCHSDEYQAWQTSHHATALSDPRYIESASQAGNPTYCQSCHATGYDAVAGTVVYEGVSCTACHQNNPDPNGPHMTVDKSSQLCGQCHTGTHAPDYDEWLTSGHAKMGIDCEDCHQSHSTDLRMADPTQLCVSCHQDNFDASVHGQEGMSCHDCHMASEDQIVDPLTGRKKSAGHTFNIPSTICESCHGMTHTIQASDITTPVDPAAQTDQLQANLSQMESKANNNLNLGLTGGGIGGLLVGVSVPFLLRRRNKK